MATLRLHVSVNGLNFCPLLIIPCTIQADSLQPVLFTLPQLVTACDVLHAALSMHNATSLELVIAGPANFGPSSSAMPPLPLSLPFAPDLLTSEDQPDGDIPFPVLRYEEELLAGLILFQHEGGAVSSVDHLLALQPQCAMPTELARHFHGQSD